MGEPDIVKTVALDKIPQKRTERPQVRYLNRYVRDPLCAAGVRGPDKWFDLGLTLMGEGSRNNLEVISIDKRNTYQCCDAMFGLWLQRVPTASWEQLIKALEEISMDDIVKDLTKRLQGCDRPALKYLNKYVRDEASTKWHDLGLELLEPEDEGKLNEIKANHPQDNGECCKQMFQLWLEKYPHATWNQLVQALKEIKLYQLASKIDGMLITTEVVELPPKQSSDTTQSPSQHSVSFSAKEDIDSAFSRLSASVTSTIAGANFSTLQRAAIERAKSPKMIQKSNELVPIIDGANSFQTLCTMLAKTSYWNFLDIRMMDAMAAASLIPAAQQSVENFKKTFFGMTLAEAAPYFPIIPLKSGHTTVTEELDKDPSKMTIFDLHKHRFYLETELLQTGCTICRIVVGSVMITWQIHVDHVYKAYCSLKKQQPQLQSQDITTLSITVADIWGEVPITWRGQDVQQTGPIIPLPEKVQQKSYLLPKGLQWTTLDIEVIANEYKNMHYALRELLQWITFHPLTPDVTSSLRDNDWSFVVKRNNQPVGAMLNYPVHIRLGKLFLKFVRFFYTNWSMSNKNGSIMFKESIRRVNLSGFNQGITYFQDYSIFKPFVTLTQYEFIFSSKLSMASSPKIPGWRPMTSQDIPSALALTNKYSSQFEIGQVFQSEKEFSYHFMCPVVENYMQAFVVEDPVTGDITDVAGFKLERGMDGRKTFAYITILAPMKSPPRQLLIDLLVCAKEAKADILYTFRFGLNKEVFEDLLTVKSTSCYWHFVNYQYDEVDESEYCLFCY